MDQLACRSVEDHVAFVHHEKLCAVVDAAVGQWFDLAGLLVEAVRGQPEGVLQAVGDDQRRGLRDVALLDDQVDDWWSR